MPRILIYSLSNNFPIPNPDEPEPNGRSSVVTVENVQNVENVYDYNDFNKQSDTTA